MVAARASLPPVRPSGEGRGSWPRSRRRTRKRARRTARSDTVRRTSDGCGQVARRSLEGVAPPDSRYRDGHLIRVIATAASVIRSGHTTPNSTGPGETSVRPRRNSRPPGGGMRYQAPTYRRCVFPVFHGSWCAEATNRAGRVVAVRRVGGANGSVRPSRAGMTGSRSGSRVAAHRAAAPISASPPRIATRSPGLGGPYPPGRLGDARRRRPTGDRCTSRAADRRCTVTCRLPSKPRRNVGRTPNVTTADALAAVVPPPWFAITPPYADASRPPTNSSAPAPPPLHHRLCTTAVAVAALRQPDDGDAVIIRKE